MFYKVQLVLSLCICRPVLSTAMRSSKIFFSIDKNENLLPKFLFISNSYKKKQRYCDHLGNERVLKARLSDANFFGTLINLRTLKIGMIN